MRAALKDINDLRNDAAHRHLSTDPEISDRADFGEES